MDYIEGYIEPNPFTIDMSGGHPDSLNPSDNELRWNTQIEQSLLQRLNPNEYSRILNSSDSEQDRYRAFLEEIEKLRTEGKIVTRAQQERLVHSLSGKSVDQIEDYYSSDPDALLKQFIPDRNQ